MDCLISEEYATKIADTLENLIINTKTSNPKKFEETIMRMFDGEEYLYETITKLLTNLSAALDQSNVESTQERNVILRKYLSSAVLVGFLSERYVRDKMLDNDKDSGLFFAREYESMDAFLNRLTQATEQEKDFLEIVRQSHDEAIEETE